MDIDAKVNELNKLIEARRKILMDANNQKNQYFVKLANKLESLHRILKKFNISQLKVDIQLKNVINEAPYVNSPLSNGTIFIKNKKDGSPDFIALWDYTPAEPPVETDKKKSSKKPEPKVIVEPFTKICIDSFDKLPPMKQNAMLNVLTELTGQINNMEETTINTIMSFYLLKMQSATENLKNWTGLNNSIGA